MFVNTRDLCIASTHLTGIWYKPTSAKIFANNHEIFLSLDETAADDGRVDCTPSILNVETAL